LFVSIFVFDFVIVFEGYCEAGEVHKNVRLFPRASLFLFVVEWEFEFPYLPRHILRSGIAICARHWGIYPYIIVPIIVLPWERVYSTFDIILNKSAI
jgi:hypothetical protein